MLSLLINVVPWVAGNILLAAIPVVLAIWIARGVNADLAAGRRVRWAVWGPLLLVWLIFLPNGAYLLTEWRHYLAWIGGNPAYYQVYHGHHYAGHATGKLIALTAGFALYSLIGLVATGLAIWPLDRLASRYFRTGPLLAAVFALCSLGVYMGLVKRLNSWEIMTPYTIKMSILTTAHVFTHPGILLTAALFAFFLWGVYAAFRVFMRGLEYPNPPRPAS